jgi:hypothetical protein
MLKKGVVNMGFTNINKTSIREKINTVKDNTEKLRKSPAVKFTDRTPIFGTFYNVDEKKSTTLSGTDDIQNDIGDDSPLRFNKIIDCVMFGLEDWSKNKEDDEYKGMRIENDNVSIIPLDSFKPIVNSFFTLELDNHVYLYRVTKVERTMIRNQSNYKIKYEKAFSDEDSEYTDIEEQVIDEYTMLYDNIGTDLKSIIKNNVIDNLEVIEKSIDKLNTLYMSQYYDENTETIILKLPNEIIYSPYVSQFINESDILYDSKFGNKIISPIEFSIENNFSYNFQNSFFIKVMNKDTLTKKDMTFTVRYIDDNSFEFNFTSLNIYHNRDIKVIERNKVIYDMFDMGMDVDLLELSEPSETSSNTIDIFLYNYLNGVFDISLLDFDNIFNNYCLDNFFKIPLILFIARYEYNNKIGQSMIGYEEMFSNKIL